MGTDCYLKTSNKMQVLPFGAEGSADLPNLPFSELGSQSNTNFESAKSIVLRIGINQTHPKISENHNLPLHFLL